MKKTHLHIYLLLNIQLILMSCVEEIPLVTQNDDIENLIVVEATITDQLKYHKIKLNFSKKFEDASFLPVNNASVVVRVSNGESFTFEEQDPGEYFSVNEFAAIPGSTYQLTIETNDGKTITSAPEQLVGSAMITDIIGLNTTNDKGIDGVALRVLPKAVSGNAQYFRYEYEETYKIVAPNWTPLEFIVVNDAVPDFEVDTQPRAVEQQTCYNNVFSTAIILNKKLSSSNRDQFEFRFLSRDNPIFAERYTVNLIQYTQSKNAANYWETLLDFSSQENIFSQIQPGFLNGNLNIDNKNELVIGYFEVASVSSKRVFFNRSDFYNEADTKPYFVNCSFIGSPPLEPLSEVTFESTSPLIDAIQAGLITYFGVNETPDIGEGPFLTTATPCGDCTVLGTNEKPEYWID